MKFQLPEFNQLTGQMQAFVKAKFSDDHKNLVIQGSAGTGKTVIAIHRVKELLKSKQKVLFLKKGKLLDKQISFVGGSSFAEISKTVDSLYGTIKSNIKNLLESQMENSNILKFFNIEGKEESISFDGNKFCYKNSVGLTFVGNDDYYSEQSEGFLSGLFSCWGYYFSDDIYDEIVIDEGQDLTVGILKALNKITKNITIFIDDNQGLSDNGITTDDLIKILTPGVQPYILEKNFRNTKEILEYAMKFLPKNEQIKQEGTLANAPSDPSSAPKKEKPGNHLEFIDCINRRIDESEKNNQDMGILCFKKDTVIELHKVLSDENITHGTYVSGFNNLFHQNVALTTYKSGKGLEFDRCIIILDNSFGETLNNSRFCNQMYVLATRAKKKLYLLYTPNSN